MKARPTRCWPFAAFVTTVACRHADRAPIGEQTSLPAGIAAVVAGDRIDVRTVVEIAAASGVTPRIARDRAVFDALLAAAAKEDLTPGAVRRARARAAARVLLESFTSHAHQAGPATDAEIQEGTNARWWELDRPPLRRTTHVVVTLEKGEQEKAARALAERLAVIVAPATSASSFRALAGTVSAPDLKIKVEDLDPVTEDRRAVNPESPPPPGQEPNRYSAAYVAGVYAVPGVNRMSPVVRSEFGFHVIFVSELLPEHRVPLEERRRLLEPEVFIHRAARLEKEALQQARAVDRVNVERSAVELTKKIDVQR